MLELFRPIDSVLQETEAVGLFRFTFQKDDGSGVNREGLKARLFYLLLALTIVDGVQTVLVVQKFGLDAEFNPIMRRLLSEFSAYGLIWMKALMVFVVLVLLERIRSIVLLGAVLGMTGIVFSNAVQIYMLIDRW
ncbi:MAG: DUF5658 family protein [Planctomycetota bacterium]